MNKKDNNEIEIIINRFKVNDFDYTINKSAVLLKKFPKLSMRLVHGRT